MIQRLPVLLILLAPLLAISCGNGGVEPTAEIPASPTVVVVTPEESAPSPSPSIGASAAPIDPSRFVFGASPGKPAVYWIHTDW